LPNGVWGLKGWQMLFLIEGLPSSIFGVAVYFYLKDRPGDAAWLTPAQKSQIASELAADPAQGRASHASLWPALRDRRFLSLVAIAVAGAIGTSGIGLWLPTIIRETGVADMMAIGLMSAIPYGAAILVQFLNARHSDRTGERRWHSAGPLMIAAVGWSVMPFIIHSPWTSIAVMTLVTCATFSFTGPFWSMPTAMLSGTAAAGGLGLITTMLGLGSFVSPVLVGWLSDRTHSLAAGEFYYAAVLLLGGMTLIAGTRKDRLAADSTGKYTPVGPTLSWGYLYLGMSNTMAGVAPQIVSPSSLQAQKIQSLSGH
jgi:predicted MFS family arabinose efflux permease